MMEKVLYEGKEHLIVADYGNGQIEIREVSGRREILVSKDKIQPVPKRIHTHQNRKRIHCG